MLARKEILQLIYFRNGCFILGMVNLY